MDTIRVTRQVAAPVRLVWRCVSTMATDCSGTSVVVTEVLGGQAPTLLTFRLLRGAPVRRNAVSVQLHPTTRGSTEVVVEAAFQSTLLGSAGHSRRRFRWALDELMDRLEHSVEDHQRLVPPAAHDSHARSDALLSA